MQFHTLSFGLFFTAVFLFTWLPWPRRAILQNLVFLAANVVFYALWDWRFLPLLYGGALVDYLVGLRLESTERPRSRKFLLGVSVGLALGLLATFKYLGFFVGSFVDLLHFAGLHASEPTLRLVLPLGISFYTLMRMTYVLDLYHRRLRASRELLPFLCFSGCFLVLIAGPIERASRMLPQFQRARSFDPERARDGLRRILWGLFQKAVIADTLAVHVDAIFRGYASLPALELAMGAFFFAVQVYADFAGYSEMACGFGQLLGLRIVRNFDRPYFARDIAEFWRRWHISLSTWLRDYIYTPLTMGVPLSRRATRLRNILVTFTVSGLWHGANWTYVVWGFLHGLLFVPVIYGNNSQYETKRIAEGRLLPRPGETLRMGLLFLALLVAWVVFRADSLGHALGYLRALATHDWFVVPRHKGALLLGAGFLAAEWFLRARAHPLAFVRAAAPARWAAYGLLTLVVLFCGKFGRVEFFYFRF